MTENYMLHEEIEVALENAKDFVNNFNEFNETLSKIDSILAENRWQGQAAKKAADIHSLIIKYSQTLQPISSDLYNSLDDLLECSEDFYSESSNVKKLEAWEV